MSNETDPQEETDDLQFETAEPAVVDYARVPTAPPTCIGCKRPIVSTYFAMRDKMICPSCRAQVDAPPPGTRAARVLKATLMGLGAGLVGALIWYAIRYFAHLEIGIVAVVVGVMVGKAVRKGSGNRGGRGYQVLAVVLTYCCIAANYTPDVVQAFIRMEHEHHSMTTPASNHDNNTASDDDSNSSPTPAAAPVHKKVGVLKAIGAIALLTMIIFGIAMAAPFLGGVKSAIGLLIIGFALWEAWKFNQPRSLAITGPYQLGSPGSGVRA